MPTVHEQLTEQFRRWEIRGRGWQVYPEPVSPEPPFVPFDGHYLPQTVIVDDGRRPTFLSSLARKLSGKREEPPVVPEPEKDPEPTLFTRESLVELQTYLPAELNIGDEAFEHFFRNLALCHEPVAFELLGTTGRVSLQFAVGEHDGPHVRRQLQAYFPEAVFRARESLLEETWAKCDADEMLVAEFGLAREFMFPLASGKLDSFVGIIGALSELEATDLGLFQVLFQPLREPWGESILRSVTHEDGKPFFINAPELAGAAEKKVASPLYAAVVRIATKGETFERALQIASDLAASLRVFDNPQGNELIPLNNEQYPFYEHIEDVLRRQSRRCGMILNAGELTGFVHLPSDAVRSAALERDTGKTKAAPDIVRNETGLLLGYNNHYDESIPVRLTPDQRVQHARIIGASGTGKSTLLFNLIRQDIENGEGVAVLDPHGDLVEKLLGIIPESRIDDVILVDPADADYAIGFNILSAHSEEEKTLLASDLVAVFQRLSTSWGDQMHSVLHNAILAFLESDRQGTLADLRRFLVEPDFRKHFLESVRDTNVLYYWQKGFQHLGGNKSIGPILTRLEMFLARKPILHMVAQPENRLDFGQIMDTGKIFLAKLPEGLLGRENSHLLGTLLISKFQQLTMSRQAQKAATRRDFWIYVDEFANFITPSMAEILKGARKYRLGLTLAHQELHQLQRNAEVASAVMTHPLTRIVFRVGDDDAKKLADGFSFFEARDLKNLEKGRAICQVERSDFDFNLSVPWPEEPDDTVARRQEVITGSRKRYGTPRAQIETLLRQAWELEVARPETPKTKPPPPDDGGAAQTPSQPAPPVKPIPPSAPVSEPPKPAEVPKPASPVPVVETIPPVAPAQSKESGAQPRRDLGRGGARHKTIQERLMTEARQLGFSAETEKQLTEGSNAAADVLVQGGGLIIAVEISITTGVDHEFENVKKCLAAGVARVAVISTAPRQLEEIAAAVRGALGPEAAAKVSYHSPDDFIAELRMLAAEFNARPVPALPPGEVKRHGRTVRRHLPRLSLQEQQQRQNATHRVLENAMSRPKQ